MSHIRKAESIDINSVLLSDKKKNKKTDGKSAYVNYKSPRDKLILQLPKMILPYGSSIANKKKVDEGTEKPKYVINLSFGGYQDNPKVKALMDILNQIDEKLVSIAKAKKWMGNISEEVLRSKLKRSVKYSYDDDGNLKDYPPTLKVKVQSNYKDPEKFDTVFYDKNREITDINPSNILDTINSGSSCRTIIECRGVYFIGTEFFGITWAAKQVQVFPNSNEIKEWAFTPDSDDEEEDEDEEETEKGKGKQPATDDNPEEVSFGSGGSEYDSDGPEPEEGEQDQEHEL